VTGERVQTTQNASDNAGRPEVVTVAEAAIRLGKSERTIRRMIAAGKIGAVTIHGRQCVQLTATDNAGTATGTQAGMSYNDRREADLLREMVRRLENENARLWDMLHSMLPAPGQNVTQAAQDPRESQGRPQPLVHTVLFWIVVVFAILALVLWVFYPRTAAVPDWLKTGDELSLVKHTKHAVEWQKQA